SPPLSPTPPPPPPPPPPLSPPPSPATCIEPDALAAEQGFGTGYTETFETEHFLLAWHPGNAAVTEEAVALYADSLEASWQHQIDALGWLAPDQTDACRITVLLAQFDASWGDTGGYTDVQADGGVPYMVLNTDWLEYGDDWTVTLAAHEFNHASQFAYDVFWDEQDWWFWESTAEWVPDLLFDDANTYTWSLWAYLDAPWRSLDSMQGTVQYGHFAFNVHLYENVDPDASRATWAAAGPTDNVRDALEAATGEDFEEVVLGYSSRVAALDVEERDVWLEALGYFELDPWTHVTEFPASGGIEGRGAPQERGQNFFRFAAEETVRLEFAGEAEVNGNASEWAVAVAEVGVGGEITHWSARADENGQATVDFPRAPATDVYVAVVPLGEIGERSASYTWTADLAPDAPADTGDTGDTGGDEKEAPTACGCATGGAPTGGLLAALVGLLAVRRRR
ncbi:MAG: MYXO-CTERM sorting domain-containing protein, partial [Myxococcota bacterium]